MHCVALLWGERSANQFWQSNAKAKSTRVHRKTTEAISTLNEKMNILRKPEWLKKKIEFDESRATSLLLNKLKLNTVCREAKCPNICECFKNHQATFLILGRHCTRSCVFCNVTKSKPENVNPDEPKKIAQAVKKLGLKHVVITSVTRDDLADAGASQFIATVAALKKIRPPVTIELLIPDCKGDPSIISRIAASAPDILGHNMETVPRLYNLRPESDYHTSLSVLKITKEKNKNVKTKSALMLGLGETEKEVIEILKDLKNADCDFLALGQYLRPSLKHTPVVSYVTPEQFLWYKTAAETMEFAHVESAPYVRSSFHAIDYLAR
jgi:lipoic acid synthetase